MYIYIYDLHLQFLFHIFDTVTRLCLKDFIINKMYFNVSFKCSCTGNDTAALCRM